MGAILFRRANVLMRVPIPPRQLQSIPEGIYAYINTLIGRYIPVFGGIVICSVGEPGVLGNIGTVTGESSMVYVKVIAELIVMNVMYNRPVKAILLNSGPPAEMSVYGVLNIEIPSEFSVTPGEYDILINKLNIFTLSGKGVFMPK